MIIAYHGTYHKFDKFNRGDIGFHFSRNIDIARNRLIDMDVPYDPDYPLGTVLKVELDIGNSYQVKCDLEDWNPSGIFKRAMYKVTGKPFESPISLYLIEQKRIAAEAYKLLTHIGYTKNSIINVWSEMNSCDDIHNLNRRYSLNIKERLRNLGYDSLTYPNEYECDEGDDSLCYIAINSEQVKVVDNLLIS